MKIKHTMCVFQVSRGGFYKFNFTCFTHWWPFKAWPNPSVKTAHWAMVFYNTPCNDFLWSSWTLSLLSTTLRSLLQPQLIFISYFYCELTHTGAARAVWSAGWFDLSNFRYCNVIQKTVDDDGEDPSHFRLHNLTYLKAETVATSIYLHWKPGALSPPPTILSAAFFFWV